MLSFHNDPAIKQKYLDRVRQHREMDNIIQGTGWENGKGCAVGCTLESYDHSRYPIELGLPEWLAHLEDRIFEGLTIEESKIWPEKFLDAIPLGIDVEPIKNHLSIRRMDRLLVIQNKLLENGYLPDIINKCINAVKLIKECHRLEINKNYCDWSAAESAAESAESAAWSAAESAAWSAAWSVESAARSAESAAESAAWSAWSAAWSAWSAAESARSAARSAAESAAWSAWSARSAARSAAWKQEADDLIDLLKEYK